MPKSSVALLSAAFLLLLPGLSRADSVDFTDSFMLDQCRGFSSSGTNPFFVLQPGFHTLYQGFEGKEAVKLTITVLRQTKTVNGIPTRVVQEREWHDGELVEVSNNYFAICNRTNSVFYFGEDVDIYEGGQIVNHGGSWHAGVDGARAGVVMPGIVLLGSRYQQETADPIAMDRAEIVSMTEVVQTPAGTFTNVVKTDETTPLEPGKVESKWYANGIGLIMDDTLALVSSGY